MRCERNTGKYDYCLKQLKDIHCMQIHILQINIHPKQTWTHTVHVWSVCVCVCFCLCVRASVRLYRLSIRPMSTCSAQCILLSNWYRYAINIIASEIAFVITVIALSKHWNCFIVVDILRKYFICRHSYDITVCTETMSSNINGINFSIFFLYTDSVLFL